MAKNTILSMGNFVIEISDMGLTKRERKAHRISESSRSVALDSRSHFTKREKSKSY